MSSEALKSPSLSAEPDEEEEVTWGDNGDGGVADLLGFDLADVDTVDRSGLRALINSALVSHRRMPVLDAVFDRTARMMTTSLRHLTDENVEVALDDVSTTRFGDFQHGVTTPAVIGVLRAESLNGYGLVFADPELVFSIVDILLGGRRGGASLSPEDRGFTAIELGLAQRILAIVIEDLNTAFSPIQENAFRLDRIETNPRFASVAQEASVCALAKFRVRIEGRGGRASILLPHALLEPVRKALTQEFIGEQPGADAAWREHLEHETSEAAVDISAIIAERELTIRELTALKAGDVLTFPRGGGRRVELRAGGRRLARGDAGRAGDRVAVRLEGAAPAGIGEVE